MFWLMLLLDTASKLLNCMADGSNGDIDILSLKEFLLYFIYILAAVCLQN